MKNKNEMIEARIFLKRELWGEVKKRATTEKRKIAEVAGELIKKGLEAGR